ncbi:GNAT family N-acetyltransferase [Stappia sp. F7233]|uniref:GNAT family N-acetyltransferase n=1 Tax=Stappia albiluteola TaxID=2758565 RepID=A0A839A9R2_9HYPH|nr:GNAT family N-acetyltransferase [Stappia albiluteola]MBA5775788.1 GNAT family N-acetyltransferase [Stappia albiluteola]
MPRPFEPSDLDALHKINEACLPAVNSLSAAELRALIDDSFMTLVAELNGAPAGFVLCLDETASYDSRNFLWLQQSYPRFFYVDRIGIAPEARGRGLGEMLYAALLERLAPQANGTPLTCEVNERPPNPGSLRFHRRLGFAEVGRQDFGDKAVVYMARAITDATR